MKFQRNVSLKNYTTFKIGGRAKYFFVAKTKENLIAAIKTARKDNLPFFILGGGSNLLVSEKGYRGLVIQIQNSKLKTLASQADSPKGCSRNLKPKTIYVEAGVVLSRLIDFVLKNSLTGLEWAAGIPGQVGGAINGNAGAFEGSMADIVESVEAFDLRNQKIKNFKNNDCEFGYRVSIFKDNSNLIILSCKLQLKSGDKKTIKEKIQEYLDYRNERHPKEPSAGSVFKNVGDIPAALLIDQSGLKGKKIGGAQISKIHPNFIVNLDGAEAKDVLRLINLAKKRVKEKFGILLEEEIQFLGF